jgi:CheY-like chemotaxis protein
MVGANAAAFAASVAAPHASAPVQAADAPPDGGIRVLVVEDESLTALALAQTLQAAGYEVVGPASRVRDAIDIVKASPPDVAVLDVNLFGQTVSPVAETLHAMGVPFVFCTGYTRLPDLKEPLGRAPMLTKPVAADRLLQVIADLLASRETAESQPVALTS